MIMTQGKVLILGGTGFIGRALVQALAKRSQPVLAVSRGILEQAEAGVETIRCDCGDPDQIGLLLTGCRAIVHLASASTPGSTAGQPLAEIEANLQPTLALLQAMQHRPNLPLLYLSSAGSLYGDSAGAPSGERDPICPKSYHGAGKAAAEQFIGAWCRQFGGAATVLRPSNVYGPGQHERAAFGIVPHTFGALRRGETLTVWGDGSAERDYLYIDDLVRLCLAVLTTPMLPGLHIFNAASGQTASLNVLFDLIEATAGQPLKRRYDGSRAVDARRVAIDAGLVRRTYGWAARVALPEGLQRTWDWVNTIPR